MPFQHCGIETRPGKLWDAVILADFAAKAGPHLHHPMTDEIEAHRSRLKGSNKHNVEPAEALFVRPTRQKRFLIFPRHARDLVLAFCSELPPYRWRS